MKITIEGLHKVTTEKERKELMYFITDLINNQFTTDRERFGRQCYLSPIPNHELDMMVNEDESLEFEIDPLDI